MSTKDGAFFWTVFTAVALIGVVGGMMLTSAIYDFDIFEGPTAGDISATEPPEWVSAPDKELGLFESETAFDLNISDADGFHLSEKHFVLPADSLIYMGEGLVRHALLYFGEGTITAAVAYSMKVFTSYGVFTTTNTTAWVTDNSHCVLFQGYFPEIDALEVAS